MKIWKSKFNIVDATTSLSELFREIGINFMWGFVGNSIIVFMAKGIDTAVAINFFLYYMLMSYVVNRDKYKTRLGRFVIMPISASVGAFLGYKFAQILSKLI